MAQQQIHIKYFTPGILIGLEMDIWIACGICYVVPFITGNTVIGTRIVIVLILLSVATSLSSYISVYQKHKWKDGRQVAELRGAYVITSYQPSDITHEEDAQIVADVRLSLYYFIMYATMLCFYFIYLIMRVITSYDVIEGNSRYLVQFGVDTVLFLNALVNPCLILHYFRDIRQSVLPVCCQ